MRFIVLTSHTLLSPQSCHAYPAPLSQRNITVSYNWGRRRGGGGTESSNFLNVDWQMQLYEVCATIEKHTHTHRGSFKTIHIHHAHFRTMRCKKEERKKNSANRVIKHLIKIIALTSICTVSTTKQCEHPIASAAGDERHCEEGESSKSELQVCSNRESYQ